MVLKPGVPSPETDSLSLPAATLEEVGTIPSWMLEPSERSLGSVISVTPQRSVR